LDLCEDWRVPSSLTALRALDSTALEAVLSALVESTFLERSDRPIPISSQRYSEWNGWRPAAAYFHAATKDVRYGAARSVDDRLRRKAGDDPPPSPLKPIKSHGKAIALAAPADNSDALQRALQDRRTWRQFGSAPLAADQLATLMGLTFGVQQW